MAWNNILRQIDDTRAGWLTAGRPNMVTAVAHPTAMLHHRIAWSRLRAALNAAIAGTLDLKVVNILLSLSPCVSGPLIKDFKTAVTQARSIKPGKILPAGLAQSIEAVEAEVFSLPINAFLGPTQRADDPADDIDFTPDDIDSRGLATSTPLGELQKIREAFYAALLQRDLVMLDSHASKLSKGWIELGFDLSTPTGFTNTHWAPDPVAGYPARAVPGYRAWAGANPALTHAQSIALTAVVEKRVATKN